MSASPEPGAGLGQPSSERGGARIRTVRDALRECRLLILFAALFGVGVNLLVMTGPLYMLQVYDRVLVSNSFQTLLALTALMIAAYATLGFVDSARAALAARVGLRVERLLGERLIEGAWSRPSGTALSRGSELLRDLDAYRGFVGGPGLVIATDLPFAPLFVGVIYLLHPWLGLFAIAAIVVLATIALATQVLTRRRLAEAHEASADNTRFLVNVATASDAVRAMGLGAPLAQRWRTERDALVTSSAVAGERANAFKSATKATRFCVQSMILGLGAYLVLTHELSAGGMIAASIILGRALAPIEQGLGAWSQMAGARSARVSLDAALAELADAPTAHGPSPALTGEVALDKLTYRPPGSEHAILSELDIRIPAGASVGIIGPSGAGKSTLARLLVGVLEPTKGCVRLDGADIRHLDPNRIGLEIGYLPPDVGLLDGSVAENIARFQSGRDQEVFDAARRARVHDVILQLPQGYQTVIGPNGHALSGGQRQRIGLARALFGNPKLVVLDEPDAHLDDLGEAALQDVLEDLTSAGVTVFLVTHRAPLLEPMVSLLLISAEHSVIYGPRAKVLERLQGGRGPRKRIGPPEPAAPDRGEGA